MVTAKIDLATSPYNYNFKSILSFLCEIEDSVLPSWESGNSDLDENDAVAISVKLPCVYLQAFLSYFLWISLA